MDSKEIRESFLRFFEEKGHLRLPSASLIPGDPTLLFTSAGMVPLKSYFLQEETPPSNRITTVQKCLRTNDIENVGYTSRHHTFFEMLGNFSIGDYFKEEAIAWALEYVVKVLQLPYDRLWVTIYKDDAQARDIWKKYGIPENKIIPLGEEDNFWTMGSVGPCGPCSEIYFDRGILKEGEENELPGSSGERFLEFWNLVFTQFDRKPDGSLIPLPKKNIDTGMGLERITSIIEEVPTDFDTDLFLPIIKSLESITKRQYREDVTTERAFRAIADHIRAVVFLIGEGIVPGNERRSYVLRRLIRRSALFGRILGVNEPFLYNTVHTVVELLGEIYPEITRGEENIVKVLKLEEERFNSTLESGFSLFRERLNNIKRDGKIEFPAEDVFYMYDTLGFPVELSEMLIKDNGLTFNKEKFQELMEMQRKQARFSFKGFESYTERVNLLNIKNITGESVFKGYNSLKTESIVKGILKEDAIVDSISEGESCSLILDVTPFYAEKGGQVGDRGIIEKENFTFVVEDTKAPIEGLILHYGTVRKGVLCIGDRVIASVDPENRHAIMRAHTATHLLQAILRESFGNNLSQQGSQVYPDEFRFDFNFSDTFPKEKIGEIENKINEIIMKGLPVSVKVMKIEEARKEGALAFFEEKYGDLVRVVEIEGVSKELCGGTHVLNTGAITLVVLTNIRAVSSGTKRIEGLSGKKAYLYLMEKRETLRRISELLSVGETDILSHLNVLMEDARLSRKEAENYRKKLLEIEISQLSPIFELDGVPIFAKEFDNLNPEWLRKAYDTAKKLKDRGIVLFKSVNEGNDIILLGAISVENISMQKFFNRISMKFGFKGGGNDRLAQGSSRSKHTLQEILEALR